MSGFGNSMMGGGTAMLEQPRPLVESFSVDVNALNEGRDGGWIKELPDGRYRVRCKGQHCGIINRNNRIYPAESTWGKHTRAESAFMRRVRARRVTGQLEHPADGKSSMGLAAICIVEVEAPDPKTGEVWIIFETMSTEPGRVVEAYIRDGVGFGMSSRGNGSVRRRKDGVDEVQGDFEPITFDCVIDESTPGSEVPSRVLRESLACLDRTCALLMESAGGDERKAREIAQQRTEEAIQRDALAVARSGALNEMAGGNCGCGGQVAYPPQTGMVPTAAGMIPTIPQAIAQPETAPPGNAHHEYLLGLPDGSGHYRGYLNSVNQWDVWLLLGTLPPTKVAQNLPTSQQAKQAAETHAARVMRESYTVGGAVPFNGTMLTLRFDSEAETKKAMSALEGAGFNAHRKGEDGLCVYTSYEDPTQAEAHILRALGNKNIEPREESFGAIRRGQIVWEDTMPKDALLREIRDRLNALNPVNEMGMGHDDDMYGDDDADYMEGGYYEADDEDEPEDDEPEAGDGDDEDDEDDAEEAIPGIHYRVGKKKKPGRREMREYEDDPDIEIDGSPEDELGADRMPEGVEYLIVYPRKVMGEAVGASVAAFDAEGNLLATESVEVEALDVLGEAKKGGKVTNPQQVKAIMAKAWGNNKRAATARGGTKKNPKPKQNQYYRNFRAKGAKAKGQNQTAARMSGKRVQKKKKKGKKKSRGESVEPMVVRTAKAAATLLTSPMQEDVLAATRLVLEQGADWPAEVQHYVGEALARAHGLIEDKGLAKLVGQAAEHIRALDESGDDDALVGLDWNADDEIDEAEVDTDDTDEIDEAEGCGGHDIYEAEIERLTVENARLTELVGALTDLNTAQAVESKVDILCHQHPALRRVRDKLLTCETVEEVVGEADTYMSLIGESAAPAPAPKPSGANNNGNGNGAGSLSTGQLEEGLVPAFKTHTTKSVGATSSRVAAYRRRQRNQRG